MTPFLKALAQKFVQTSKLRDELYRYRFFFQNKRAGKFFHHYLKELAPDGALIILPEVTTLPTYLRQRQHLVEEDVNNDLFLVYHLYNVYNELIESKGGSSSSEEKKFPDLNSFFPFGQQIIIDFNDLDLQLADHNVVFRNLQELKDLDAAPSEYLSKRQLDALEQFIKRKKDEKPFEKRFSTFYNDLGHLYIKFKERLREEHLTYNGMLLRDTINHINEKSLDLCADEKYNVFVGLNALSKAEKEILKHFKGSGNSFFYWDYDSILFDNSQLAGSFKSENLELFPEPKQTDALYLERDKINSLPELEVIATPSKIAQAAYIGAELNELAKTEEGRRQLREMKVAVVLANERLLSPLLANLDATLFIEEPTDMNKKSATNLANVTMGYPIKELPLVGLLLRLLQLQKIRQHRSSNYWRGNEVSEILSNNIFEIHSSLQRKINEEKLIFIDDTRLRSLIDEEYHKDEEKNKLLNMLFFVPDTDDGLITYLSNIVNHIFEQENNALTSANGTEEDEDQIELEPMNITALRLIIELLEKQKRSLSHYHQHHKEEQLGNYESPFNFDTLYDILTNLLNRARIPFSGEPLRGLQIMGILETRGLDFDTVYVVDATDGVLPANTKVMGIIPHLLRAGHQLPTFKWQEQTRSYNFFRLISRARKVVALYDSRKDGSSRGEPSRYIQQLQYVYNIPKLKMTTAGFDIIASKSEGDDYQIDHEAIERYRESITTGSRYLSPTRINDYIDCPRKFYFKSILGIKEQEELDDLLNEGVLGSLVHDTIDRLYTPFIGNDLDPEILNSYVSSSSNSIKNKLEESFKELNKGSNIPEAGINKINYDIAYSLVENIINMDLEFIREGHHIRYIGGEVKIKTALALESSNQDKNATPIYINVTGSIDRIDYTDRVYRIIDYKTGGDSYDLDLEKSLDITGKQAINKAAVQLLNYCLVTYRNGLLKDDATPLLKQGSELMPLMIKPRSKEVMHFTLKNSNLALDTFSKVKEDFGEAMDTILLQIAESDNNFTPNPSRSGVCNYCVARGICPNANITRY